MSSPAEMQSGVPVFVAAAALESALRVRRLSYAKNPISAWHNRC